MKATTTTTTFSSSVAATAVRHHHHHPPPPHRRRRQRSSTLTIKAHDGDDDEPIPVLRIPKVKTPQDVGVNPKYKQLIKEQTTQEEERQKDTVGARLQMVRSAMLDAEAKATQDASKFQSDAWSGDQYVGSPINSLTVLLGIGLITPLLFGIFAALTYGSLWGKQMM